MGYWISASAKLARASVQNMFCTSRGRASLKNRIFPSASSVCTFFQPWSSTTKSHARRLTSNTSHRSNQHICNIWYHSCCALWRLSPLLLRHWYEIMALYYVKSILTEISASRQDRRVLQKSKIIRIEFLSKWGMLQTSRYV